MIWLYSLIYFVVVSGLMFKVVSLYAKSLIFIASLPNIIKIFLSMILWLIVGGLSVTLMFSFGYFIEGSGELFREKGYYFGFILFCIAFSYIPPLFYFSKKYGDRLKKFGYFK